MTTAPQERQAQNRTQPSGEGPTPKGATLAIASIATALVLTVFCEPLTTLTITARAFGAGPGA